MEVALDNVRTHAPDPVVERAADSEPGISSQPASAPTLMAVADTNASPEQGTDSPSGASDRNVAVFSTAIPRFMPLPLRGSHEILVHQNVIADVEGLSRIQNNAQLGTMVRSGDLVALPESASLEIDPRLPENRRYCRPWTAKFLSDLSRAHESVFGSPLQLTSAVRTVNFQRHLEHYNGNAAPASGDTASPHLTGEAIDLGKKGMSLREIAWMREVLGRLQTAGKLDVEEEFEQACFHISVYKTYSPRRAAAPERLVATNEGPNADGASASATVAPAAEPMPASYHASVSTPVKRAVSYRRVHRYSSHRARRTVAHRRRRHHRSMSLIAAGLR